MSGGYLGSRTAAVAPNEGGAERGWRRTRVVGRSGSRRRDGEPGTDVGHVGHVGEAAVAWSRACAGGGGCTGPGGERGRRRTGGYGGRVRLTQFRELMEGEFGAARAASLSHDHVFAELGGRTVEQALAAGLDTRDVWRAVCTAFEIPPVRR